jgi:hypothetical protein
MVLCRLVRGFLYVSFGGAWALMIERLTDLMIEWLTDLMTERLIDLMTERLIDSAD